MSSDTWPLWETFIIIGIIVVNGYFVAARRAFGSVNKTNIRAQVDDGEIKLLRALAIIEEPDRYKLAVRSLNVILAMLVYPIGLSAYSEKMISLLRSLGMSNHGLEVIASDVIIFVLLAFLFILVGIVFPRRVAVIHDDVVAASTAMPVMVMTAIMTPFIKALSIGAFLLLKLFRQRTDINDNEYSEEDIVEMLEAGQESGELKEEGKKMITGVFAFDDILAYETMTPRTDVFAIDINEPTEEYIDELMELRYSRIPVYEDDSDNIIGILYIKDYLIKARNEGFDNVDIRSILRKPYFVPETKNIDSLFFELQKTKQHIAILIDEYGGFSGIVTMEDIIEEVMGDIDDEYDEEEQELKCIGENLYLVDGGMNLDDLDEELGINLESDDSETIGGFIIDLFGEIPDEDDIGKEIEVDNCAFTIKSVKDRRIEQVMMKILK